MLLSAWLVHSLKRVVIIEIFQLFVHNTCCIAVIGYHCHSFPACNVWWQYILSSNDKFAMFGQIALSSCGCNYLSVAYEVSDVLITGSLLKVCKKYRDKMKDGYIYPTKHPHNLTKYTSSIASVCLNSLHPSGTTREKIRFSRVISTHLSDRACRRSPRFC